MLPPVSSAQPRAWQRLRLWIAVFALAAGLDAAESARRVFDVPADAADRSIKRFSEQSGLEVFYASSVAQGIRTNAVKGEMTAREALDRLLAGTGLTAIRDEKTGAISLRRTNDPNGLGTTPASADGRPFAEASSGGGASAARGATETGDTGAIAGRITDPSTGAFLTGAEITLAPSGAAAVSGRDGTFQLRSVPAGVHQLTATYVGYESKTVTVDVQPGATARAELGLSPEAILMATVTIEGAREGQARALSEQRSAINMVNLVSADAIGNFPDVNAAEALKRMPGISTVRQRGEDRDITIRGAAPNLNSITIDGVSVMSNQQDGRTVSMDVYPAEQLAGIEITKSALPSMDGDSIGGAINLRTKSAFDSKERILAANAYLQYNDLADQFGYRGGLNFSDLLGRDRDWGLQFSASVAQRKALEHTVEPAGWNLRSGTAAGAPYAGYVPNNLPFTYVDIERERTGGSFSLERRLGEATRLYLRVSHNVFVERNGRPRFVVQNLGSNISNAFPVTVANDRVTRFTSTSIRGQRVVNPREFTDTGSSYALGGETVVGDWKLELVGAFARGTNLQDSVTGQWQTRQNTTASVDLTDSRRPVLSRSAGPDLNDPSTYAFNQLQIQERRIRGIEYSIKGDATRELTVGNRPFRFSAGFKHRWSPKRFDTINTQFNTLASGAMDLNDSRLGGVYEVDPGFLDGLMPFGPTVAPYAFYDFAKANRSLFTPNAGATLQNELSSDYYVREEITAGYAMGQWTLGPLTALAGGRLERTRTEAKGYRQNSALPTSNPARYEWVRADSSYDEFLPGVHLRYAPRKRTVFRASWNNTLARPATNRISPSLTVATPATPSPSDPVTVTGGNPDLTATTSENIDLSVEHYFKQIGLVSAGWFHKRLDGPIYRRTFDGTYEGQPARLTVFSNAGEATVSGWEFVYQQQLRRFPAPFDGLGVYANLTYVDSEVTLTEPGRVGETVPLFNQSDQLGNLALTYQKHGIFVRLSHNWRGDYLQALANPGLDQYARGFESYDLLASYQLGRRWALKFEANNLTKQPEGQYVGTSERNLYFGDTGRSYALGVTFNY